MMNLTDLVKASSEKEELLNKDNTFVDLEEVEKTAELLDNLSKEDTLIDDLAKLAVLQDVIGNNKKNLEKVSSVGSWRQLAKSRKALQIEKDLEQVARNMRQAAKHRKKAEKIMEAVNNVDEVGEGSLSALKTLGLVGGSSAIGAAVATNIQKNKQKQIINEIANYYENKKAVKK